MSMTEVLHSPSHFPSSPSPSPSSSSSSASGSLTCAPPQSDDDDGELGANNSRSVNEGLVLKQRHQKDQLSLLALLVTLFRKSWVACKTDRRELCAMEIGWPTNVRHVAHVTFDRFNGFLGLPVEFEPEVPRRAPSASTTVFGVSTESMQLSYDTRGNSVPTILLLMQRHLYAQGGLQAEGIFRINAENSQEEYVRDQLNRGLIPDGIDVHCLASLIKAWFRELPTGVLDSLSPEQVMQCQTEEECIELVRRLPPTEGALLDWAINLMADVVEQEHINKMNARNIAMVFAPNMTQMADPLTALMYAVQVMNFLKTLILRTLREREDSVVEPTPASRLEPFDENGHQSPQCCTENSENNNDDTEQSFIAEEPVVEKSCNSRLDNLTADTEGHKLATSFGKPSSNGDQFHESTNTQVHALLSQSDGSKVKSPKVSDHAFGGKSRVGQSSESSFQKVPAKLNRQQSVVCVATPVEKTRGISNLSRIDSRSERIEAWR